MVPRSLALLIVLAPTVVGCGSPAHPDSVPARVVVSSATTGQAPAVRHPLDPGAVRCHEVGCGPIPAAHPHAGLTSDSPDPGRPDGVDATAPHHRHPIEHRVAPQGIERPEDRRDPAEVAGFVTASLLSRPPNGGDPTPDLAEWAADEILITHIPVGEGAALGEATWFEAIRVDSAPRPGSVIATVTVEKVTAGEGAPELVVRAVVATLVEDAGGWHVASLEWAR